MRTMREFLNVKSKEKVDDLCDGMLLRTERTFYFYFLLPSLVIMAVSLFLDLGIFTENVEFYFQRAGALVVALFVAVEFRLYRHIARYERVVSTSKYIQKNGEKLSDDNINDYCEKYLSDSRVFRYLLAAGGIAGTLIWGYGDLLLEMFL